MTDVITVDSPELPFALLSPVKTQPLERSSCHIVTLEQLCPELLKLTSNDTIAIDIETTGLSPVEDRVVGVGFCWLEDEACYLPIVSNQHFLSLCHILGKCKAEFIAQNLKFDSAFFYNATKKWLPNWVACTLGLYKHLATEGFKDQKWGLKKAQVDLLGWEATNEVELDDWLIANGYTKQNGNPEKGEMWRAPVEILGMYCCLDAHSTYLLFKKVLEPVAVDFPQLVEYHTKHFINLVKLHVMQQIRGTYIDEAGVRKYQEELLLLISKKEEEFLLHPKVHPHILEYDKGIADAHKEKEPKYLLKKYTPGVWEGKEPTKFKKDGGISKNYLKWLERDPSKIPLEEKVSKNWTQWNEKLKLIESAFQFNLNSNQQLGWLLYEKLGEPIRLYTKDKEGNPTETPSVSEEALSQMGEIGNLLVRYNKLTKEEGYVKSCISHLRDGIIHPGAKVPGTLTGRCAGGGGLNIQQLPKREAYLKCWRSRPNHKWLQCDFTALEPMVLTEMSKDKAMWGVYGPGAPLNDMYLFVGSQLPILGPELTRWGYDPYNPTLEAIGTTKKNAKKFRAIAKTLVLGSNYGAGPATLHNTLTLGGIKISLREVETLHREFWKLFSGIKKFEKALKREWSDNNGWFLNGIGRPIGVCEKVLKDLVNRCIQSTGHDILMVWLSYMLEIREEREWWDLHPIIVDFHDETIWECREENAEEYQSIFPEAYRRLNNYLGGEILLKGDPLICDNLAEIKIED